MKTKKEQPRKSYLPKKETKNDLRQGEGSRAGDNSGQKGAEIGTQMTGGAKKWKKENEEDKGWSPLEESARDEGKSFRRKETDNY